MTLPTQPARVTITPTSERGAYGYHLNEKAMTLQVTASYQVRSNVCDVAITDTLQAGVVSFEAAHRLLCAMCLSVATLGSGRKLESGLLMFNRHYTIEQVC